MSDDLETDVCPVEHVETLFRYYKYVRLRGPSLSSRSRMRYDGILL